MLPKEETPTTAKPPLTRPLSTAASHTAMAMRVAEGSRQGA
jgi:hypothetical protein